MRKTLSWLACLALLAPPATAFVTTPYAYGAWLPYWDAADAITEAEALSDVMDTAIAFTCIFDANDQPLMLPDTRFLLTELNELYTGTDTAVYLSITNDIELAEGQYANKSSDLLRRLFADEAAASSHLEALIKLLDDYNLSGLELDYENLKDDRELWASYASFISRLWKVCEREGVSLRVVLPWDAPKYATLPVGPTYSVMCYNLFGYHSGPGPKADISFLRETCELYNEQSQYVRMAFATGGFDWHNQTISALTQHDAEALLIEADATPTRDSDSAALTATFILNDETHEIWYADAATLCTWRDVCASYGIRAFDLFRLGGNDLTDITDMLFQVTP